MQVRIADVEVEVPEGAELADLANFAHHLARSEHGLLEPELVSHLVVRRVRHNPHAGPTEGVWFDRWTLIYSDAFEEGE